ncbi:hypothetical protein AURDEDRAFT_172838 [Auricularia subglabra TFB-10046 SS5]|uniref:Uncharacterized protein n=1 Tax=Auricularia subglabra (strain TFB-10046 / SS5) TaxID=717982 RepID=J0WWW3_AURST|nr:hypothetical protein AURDEDRAFT_172838 [Auricularia subglabra TFB-10046 SS5]
MFPQPSQPPSLSEAYSSTHPQWFIRVFMALVLLLNTRYHVGYTACSLILLTVHVVFTALGLLAPDLQNRQQHRFQSFSTILSRFGLADSFTVYPLCPACHTLAPADAPDDHHCENCGVRLYREPNAFERATRRKPPPLKSVAQSPLSQLLADVLSDDALQDECLRSLQVPQKPGEYVGMASGRIMRTLRDATGKPFFRHVEENPNELRVGLTMTGDAFKPHISDFCDNHSVTAFAFFITSLPFALQYALQNILVPTLIPGPAEPNCEEIQRHLEAIVDCLLMLYTDGILVYSKRFPEGRCIRFILLAVVCDHPALCRICGFADHSSLSFPCTKCTVPGKVITTPDGVLKVWPARSGAEHKRLAWEWKNLSPPEREIHWKKHGVRWFELARLPYFDPVRMAIVDPMHCMLLGIVKNLWFYTWIRGTKALRIDTEARDRELSYIHRLLQTMEAPPWVGRLPKYVGEPRGGNLSSDEYKVLSTVVGPVIIPVLWWELSKEIEKETRNAHRAYKKKVAEYEKKLDAFVKARKKKRSGAAATDDFKAKNPPPEMPGAPRRCKDEVPMFLSLAASFQLLLARSLTETDRAEGHRLLMQHLTEFCRVYGGQYLKPNHHWCTHIAEQIIDYGPVYLFWAYPGERLNKTIKGFNTNNHRGGAHDLSLSQLAQAISVSSGKERDLLSSFQTDRRQVRGTVDVVHAAQPHRTAEEMDLSVAVEDTMLSSSVRLGGTDEMIAALSPDIGAALAAWYRSEGLQIYSVHDARQYSADWVMLYGSAFYHGFIVIDGRRIIPVERAPRKSANSALVRVRTTGSSTGQIHGEVVSCFSHHQPGQMPQVFVAILPFVEFTEGLLDDDWDYWTSYLISSTGNRINMGL